jgi:hypothetical protein
MKAMGEREGDGTRGGGGVQEGADRLEARS